MALTDAYVQTYGQLGDFFNRIREGQAPERFTIQHLKDVGFTSTNHRALLPLLKALGFLSQEGAPTKRYHEYRDASQSKRVMAEAVRDAYGDLLVIRARPAEADRALIEGKFKSTHNASDRLAKLMANTFFALLALADLDAKEAPVAVKEKQEPEQGPKAEANPSGRKPAAANLHYNIQIHLPATKDIEVFNAIFKSLREHLIE